MALRVWLPLNGSVENKGISNTTMSGSPASWGNGKIGKCATFTGNVGNVIYNNTTDYNYTDKFSWAVWINTNFTGTTSQFAFTNGRADAGGYGYGLQCSNATTCNIRFGSQSFGVAVTGGEWTHLAFTKSGTSIKIYKNGSIVTDTTFTGTLPTYSDGNGLGLGCFHYSGNIYPFYGSLNDFRIYDHCLSPKEVKEISQGLVLHYKLDGWSGGVNQNLALDTVNKINTSTAATKTVALDYGLQSNFSLIRGKKITISADIILENAVSTATSGSKRVGFEPAIKYSDNTTQYMGYWIGLDSTPKTSSGRYSTIVTVQNKDFQSIVQNGTYIQGLTSGTATIKNIKVELGDEATPWSPAPQDLGIDTTKVIDSSGYGNDGTVTGILSTESDSDRYEISTHYSGSSYTDTGSGTFNWFDFSQCTLSAWIKPTASVSGWSGSIGIQHDQNAGHKGFTITDYANNFRVVTVNGSYTTIDSGKPLTVGEWHHCAAVLNGTNLKMYYDGAMVKESTISWGSAAIATDMRFATGVDFPGTDEKFTGNYSDVRMYCTALSAEDILDLYHTSANIDNEKRLHSFEFVEQSGNMFAGSPLTGSLTWDATNNYYTITSNPSTSTWGIGPAVGTSPKKIIPWGMSYILTYEVYSPTAAQWYIDYNNNDPTTSLSGNDNDNNRLRTGVNVPANTWTLITYGCSNTNETKNPDHLPLYDYSTGLGPVMTNISSAITWHMKNPQWYLVDADNKEHVYENGVFQVNFLKEDDQSSYTSFRNEEKAVWSHNFIEK